jgi:hypothetical protein
MKSKNLALLILLGASTSLLSACNSAHLNFQSTGIVYPADEPKPKPFRTISELTPEARTFLSQLHYVFEGRRSVSDMKTEIVTDLLRNDLNDNGLSLAERDDNFRGRDSIMRLNGVTNIFASDYDGDGVVTEGEFDAMIYIKQLRRKKKVDEIRVRNLKTSESIIEDVAGPLRDMTAFKNADLNGDKKVTLQEAYHVPLEISKLKSQFRETTNQAPFALDFNKDGLVTKEEIEMGIDLFVAEAQDVGVAFPDATRKLTTDRP